MTPEQLSERVFYAVLNRPAPKVYTHQWVFMKDKNDWYCKHCRLTKGAIEFFKWACNPRQWTI